MPFPEKPPVRRRTGVQREGSHNSDHRFATPQSLLVSLHHRNLCLGWCCLIGIRSHSLPIQNAFLDLGNRDISGLWDPQSDERYQRHDTGEEAQDCTNERVS